MELDAIGRRPRVGSAANHNNSPRVGLDHSINQDFGQQEVAQVIHRELFLDAVHLLEFRQAHDAGVENQPINRNIH